MEDGGNGDDPHSSFSSDGSDSSDLTTAAVGSFSGGSGGKSWVSSAVVKAGGRERQGSGPVGCEGAAERTLAAESVRRSRSKASFPSSVPTARTLGSCGEIAASVAGESPSRVEHRKRREHSPGCGGRRFVRRRAKLSRGAAAVGSAVGPRACRLALSCALSRHLRRRRRRRGVGRRAHGLSRHERAMVPGARRRRGGGRDGRIAPCRHGRGGGGAAARPRGVPAVGSGMPRGVRLWPRRPRHATGPCRSTRGAGR